MGVSESRCSCEWGNTSKTDVMVYTVYTPDRPDARFDGECTSTRKDGTFVFHTGPESTKCSSVSLVASDPLDMSEAVLRTRLCLESLLTSSSELPCKTHSSAPVVTKLENRLRLRPPRRLLRKLGNHSPVFWGMRGRVCVVRTGEPVGVSESSEAALLLFRRV